MCISNTYLAWKSKRRQFGKTMVRRQATFGNMSQYIQQHTSTIIFALRKSLRQKLTGPWHNLSLSNKRQSFSTYTVQMFSKQSVKPLGTLYWLWSLFSLVFLQQRSKSSTKLLAAGNCTVLLKQTFNLKPKFHNTKALLKFSFLKIHTTLLDSR